MFGITAASRFVPAVTQMGRMGVAFQAGRRISAPTREMFNVNAMVTSLSKAMVMPQSRMSISQIRWQHTQVNPQEKPKAEGSGEEARGTRNERGRFSGRKIHFQRMLEMLHRLNSKDIPIILLLFFLTELITSKEKREGLKECIQMIMDFIRMRKKDQIDEALKDLTLAKNVVKSVEDLKKLMGENDFKEIVDNLIEAAAQNNSRKLEALKEQEDARHKEDRRRLILAHTAEETRLKNELLKVSKEEAALREEAGKTADAREKELETNHQQEIAAGTAQIGAFKVTEANQAAEIGQLSLLISLYQQCSQKDQKCLSDINRFISAESVLGFEYKYSFSPEFMPVLKKALQANINPSVKDLNFYGTYITTNSGLMYLMEGLKNNATIESLNLKNVDLGYVEGEMMLVANMLKVNQTLKKIDLQENSYIKDKDVDCLQEALKENPQTALKTLDLSNTKVTLTKIQELRENLKGINVVSHLK